MKIKILIPVYNDWQSVSKLLGEINSSLADQKHEISIVIVNGLNPSGMGINTFL